MKAEEHTALIQQIAQNLNDQTVVTGLLATLSSDYTETLGRIEKLPQLESDNEILRSANMKLFLQVGSPVTEVKPKETKPNETPNNDDAAELKYENLFNEKGGLL